MSRVIPGYPSPWGVTVEVMERDDVPKDSDERYVFSMESALTLAGIWSPTDRKSALAALSHGNPVEILQRFGVPVRRPSLPIPRDPVYPSLADAGDDLPTEAWVTAALECRDWKARAAWLLEVMEGNFDHAQSFRFPNDSVISFAMQQIMTATLENLAEREVECLEAAAFYALSSHKDWQRVGIQWLMPIRKTWFADWIKDRPFYRRLAKELALPTWAQQVTR
ncbi:hypothetical protein [Pararhizobium gei]|uniref:hypothetical protein n=1 Tax=Pararhizobium gei TaxID=1395951 RepID=UPI0023DBEF50|nr:hypothetical protein [Rhizobium gei]